MADEDVGATSAGPHAEPARNSEPYAGFRAAGVRLTEQLLPELDLHRTEHLRETLTGIHEFDKAHVVTLAEQGLIPPPDTIAILKALREMEHIGIENARFDAQGGKHSGEQFLIRRLGEAIGGQIHLGRSSGDLGEVGRRYAIRSRLLEVMAALNQVRMTLLTLGTEHAETVMPAYTNGQRAQPTTFGHWLSMWACVFGRDFRRLRELYGRVNASPAGAAILSGTDVPIDRRRTAQLLGFSDVIPHTLDAILSHDVTLEGACVIAIHCSQLARLAEDLELWLTAEFGFIDVPDRFVGTSSIMPQKRNAHLPGELKGLSAQATAATTLAFVADKDPTGLPLLELRHVDHAVLSVLRELPGRIETLNQMLSAMIVRTERMRRASAESWMTSTDLATALVRERRLPWRTAHQLVGVLIRRCEARGLTESQVTSVVLDEAAQEDLGREIGLPDPLIREALDPMSFVRRRTLEGGPAPDAQAREAIRFHSDLQDDIRLVTDARASIERSRALLASAIDALMSADPKA